MTDNKNNDFVIDDEFRAKIASTKFVYVVARSGTGKSFCGDYLEAIRGWKHVDGDEPLKMVEIHPEWKDAVERGFGLGAYAEEMARDPAAYSANYENHRGLIEINARRALEAAKESDKVVTSHATYQIQDRNGLTQYLKDAGAKDVTTVFLYSDPIPQAKALWERTVRQAEQAGDDLSEHMKMWGASHITDLASFQKYFKEESWMYAAFEEADESEQPYVVVDNTAKDASVLDKYDEMVGIDPATSRGDGTYDDMIQKIRAIDIARDQAEVDAHKQALAAKAAEDDAAKAEQEMAEKEPEKFRARKLAVSKASKIKAGKKSLWTVAAAATFMTSGKAH